MAYLLGVDGGTESIRAIVLDLDGRPKGSHASTYQTGFPNPGWAEQNHRHRRRPRRKSGRLVAFHGPVDARCAGCILSAISRPLCGAERGPRNQCSTRCAHATGATGCHS
jgi:hypothetical protein